MSEIAKSFIDCLYRLIVSSNSRSVLLFLLIGFLITTACITPDRPKGWSKGVIIGDEYYTGTLEGDVVALAISPKIEDVDREIARYTLKGQDGMRAIYSDLVVSRDSSNYSNEQIFFSGYDGNLYALSSELIELDHIQVGDGSPLVGTVTVDDGQDVIFLGSSDSNIYAFQIYRDGRKLSLEQKWVFATEGMIWSRPIISEEILYIGSLDHKMYALNKHTGEQLWSFETRGGIVNAGLILRDVLYFGSLDSIFYSLDKRTGVLQDTYEEATGWYWSDPIADENTIFTAVLGGRVHAIGYEDGNFTSRWITDLEHKIVSQLSLVDRWIAVASEDGSIVMVRKDNGQSLRRCRLNSEVRAGVYHHDGVLYVSSYDHAVRALRVLGHKEKPDGRFQEIWTYFTDRDYTQSFDEQPSVC